MTNPLRGLSDAGQAVWLDYLHRRILEDGGLADLLASDGVRGVTSNPAIFQKAIGEGDAYDGALKALLAAGDGEVIDLYEALAVADIQAAADILRPLYDRLEGRDGFVSLEVSPYLAHDTLATLAEARRLWRAVDRPNLMIKVPGVAAGVPAIRELIAEGINVNVTLLFSLEAYLAVAEAHMEGLEARLAAGLPISGVHGVASFFVSRIDSMIDKAIDARAAVAGAEDAAALKALRGKVAIANARAAYDRYLALVGSDRWMALAAAGAAPQRLLWASTGTKDPAYSDVIYVDTLIGPDTVNTMPPATMDAFRDHGVVAQTLAEDPRGAWWVLDEAERLGLDLGSVTSFLAADGVEKFAEAFDALLGAVANKRAALMGDRLGAQSIAPGPLKTALADELVKAAGEGWTRRLWAHDAGLWTGGDEAKWLGWLAAAFGEAVDLPALKALAAETAHAGLTRVLLLGMGGSSLGPEVLAETFGPGPGRPALLVLDSTDPAQVTRMADQVDPAESLYVVASKSGSTLEPDILHRYFFDAAEQRLGVGKAGARFIAITDPGSQLEATAHRQGFRHVFYGRPQIGGRYSVLSSFGMVPAALLGLDVAAAFDSVAAMARSCGASAPPAANPGFVLGAWLGVGARAGLDKLTLLADPALGGFGAWLEQLVAESTGKQGLGLIPIDGEPLADVAAYGHDRLFVRLRLKDGADPARDALADALEAAGRPVARITLTDRQGLFQEFLRWEIATAVAGAVIGIHPFDQPDVEFSTIKTRALTDEYEREGALGRQPPVLEDGPVRLYADLANEKALSAALAQGGLEAVLAAHLDRAGEGDYLALLAYVDRSDDHIARLGALRARLARGTRAATVLQFGPRFLHSTGQAYKGGPNSGVFLQITGGPAHDLPIPGRGLTFGVVEAAQAQGDLQVLEERGRRALRLDLGHDVEAGLQRLEAAIAAIRP